jgi:hypothetical protein
MCLDTGWIEDTHFPGEIGTIVVNPNPGAQQDSYGFLWDNVLIWPGTGNPPDYLDTNGLLFTISGVPINIWDNGYGSYEKCAYNYFDVPGIFAVPEPGAVSILITMLAGLGGLASVLKRKLT